MSRNPPGEVRARTRGTKSPSRSEALRFIDSSKSPSTKIDGSLVNFRRRLSNRHGRPRRILIWAFEGNTDQTVSTSTWFAQVGSSVLIELGQIAGSAKCEIESVRAHSGVIEQFDSFSLLELLYLVRNWHCWSQKAFSRQMPQSRERIAQTAVNRHCWRAWKVVRSVAAVRQHPRTPWDWRCSFAFSSLSFDISIKNSVQKWSSDLQGLFCVKIRKMAQGSYNLSMLPLI